MILSNQTIASYYLANLIIVTWYYLAHLVLKIPTDLSQTLRLSSPPSKP